MLTEATRNNVLYLKPYTKKSYLAIKLKIASCYSGPRYFLYYVYTTNIIARLLALCYEQYYVITRASGNKIFLQTTSDITFFAICI